MRWLCRSVVLNTKIAFRHVFCPMIYRLDVWCHLQCREYFCCLNWWLRNEELCRTETCCTSNLISSSRPQVTCGTRGRSYTPRCQQVLANKLWHWHLFMQYWLPYWNIVLWLSVLARFQLIVPFGSQGHLKFKGSESGKTGAIHRILCISMAKKCDLMRKSPKTLKKSKSPFTVLYGFPQK